ncbi:hypothetical protein APSETT444_000005 [Aspergillus pseudonomiae]
MNALVNRNEKPFGCRYCDATFSRKDVIKRHHLRYHQAIAEVATLAPQAPEPALPTSPESAPPVPLEPAIMSPSTQNGFLDFSQEGNPAVMALSSRDEHSRLLMDNYIIDALLPDTQWNTQAVPHEGHAGNISGRT